MATPEQKQKQPEETFLKLLLSHQYDVWINELQNAGKAGDIVKQIRMTTELRDNIETAHPSNSDYEKFLKTVLPVFFGILKETKPQFIADNPEQKLRNMILEILNRLPNNDVFRAVVKTLLKVVMYLLSSENEENALICLRIIIDLHKNYRPTLEQEVQPFFDIVIKIYEQLPTTVNKIFSETPAKIAEPIPGKDPMFDEKANKGSQPLIRAMSSFKVLTECPIIVVLLLQLYSRLLPPNLPKFLPLIVQTLALQAPPDAYNTHRAHYTDFIAAQVKTLSFLAYMLRSFAESFRNYEEQVPRSVIQLLRNCPPELASTRRELLIATRHILATEFRKGFVPHIDTLIDEHVLIGNGRTCYETLRPLAYSMLADLVHHVRQQLSFEQLSHIAHLYSRNLHDLTLPYSIQTMSVKLILNLLECISRANPNVGEVNSRMLLTKILDTFASKFASFKKEVPKFIEEVKEKVEKESAKNASSASADKDKAAQPSESGLAPISLTSSAVQIPNIPKPPSLAQSFTMAQSPTPVAGSAAAQNLDALNLPETYRECRTLIRTLILGTRNVISAMTQSQFVPLGQGQQQPPSLVPAGPLSKAQLVEEATIFSKLFKNITRCMSIFTVPPSLSQTEEKELFEAYFAIFTSPDPRIFQEVMSNHMDFYFNSISENQMLLYTAQLFITSPHSHRFFAETLVNYLMNRLKDIATDKNFILLRLFKLTFSVLQQPSNEIESILQPHLATIVVQCLQHASECRETDSAGNYFQLLRYLFKSVASVKIDMFTREFSPLLPGLLETLNQLHDSSYSQQMRELFVELSLTVPVRLSALLPNLKLLMKPLLLSIESGSEIVMQGLRLLELCVDKLSIDFFEPIMADIKPRLMKALWRHLKLPYYSYAPQVLRILGKMAGRDRDYFGLPPQIKTTRFVDNGISLVIPFDQGRTEEVGLKEAIYAARRLLLTSPPNSPLTPMRKQYGFKFFKSCLSALLDSRPIEGLSLLTDEEIVQLNYPIKVEFIDGKQNKIIKTKKMLRSESNTLKVVLSCLFTASTFEDLTKDDAVGFFEDICTHFAVLFSTKKQPSTAKLNELDPMIFIEALLDVITSENRSHAKAAQKAIDILFSVAQKFYGDKVKAASLPVFEELALRFYACCFHKEWYLKAGGCLGISHLVSLMPIEWTRTHQLPFLKGLLQTLQDVPHAVSLSTLEDASQTFANVISSCNARNASVEQEEILREVVSFLASNLLNSTKAVRTAVQSALRALAEITGDEVSEILEPFTEQYIRKPVFEFPLKTHPIAKQTAILETLAFCLQLRPPLLRLSNELLELIEEVLVLSDTEDDNQARVTNSPTVHMEGVPTSIPGAGAQRLSQLVEFKVAALEVFAATAASEEIKADMRHKLFSVITKTIIVRNELLRKAARRAMEQTLNIGDNLPKNALSESLRPVLLKFGQWHTLSLSLLQGLACLLETHSKYFNIAIGDKILEHINKWIESQKAPPSQRAWPPGEEVQMAIACLEVYHLLPNPAGIRFLVDLINLVLRMESSMPHDNTSRELNSPYRLPLIKFLNRYATDSINYFLNNMDKEDTIKLFRGILRSSIAGPLREELAKNVNRIVVYLNDQSNYEVQFQALMLVRVLVKFIPEWLNNQSLVTALVQMWRNPAREERIMREESMPSHHMKESKILVKIFLAYFRVNQDEVALIFDLLSIFTTKTIVDFNFLRDFYQNELPDKFSVERKRNIVNHFLTFFHSPQYSNEHRVQTLQVFLTPMIDKCLNRKEEIVEKDFMYRFISDIIGKQSPAYTQSMQIEFLQLTALIVHFKGYDFDPQTHKKEIIKFAWSHFKNEDITAKQSAYLLICRFIEVYDTPDKIILQVYVALLKSYQPEAKQLVREALDIMTPTLDKKFAGQEPPHWIKWTRKVIIEDGHSLPLLIHVLQLIVRHTDIFYKYRGYFVQHISNSLARIGLLPNSAPENKKLACNLVELIINWEKKRIEESKNSTEAATSAEVKQEPTPMAVDESAAQDSQGATPNAEGGAPAGPQPPYVPPATTIEMVVNFVTRMAATPDPKDPTSSQVASYALDLLREALALWPTVNIKFAFFEKLLSPTADQPHYVITSLNILNVILTFQQKSFLATNIAALQTSLLPAISSDNMKITEALSPVLKKIFSEYSTNMRGTLEVIFKRIFELLESGVNAEKHNVFNLLYLFKTVTEPSNAAEILSPYLPHLIKMMMRLAKEHFAPPPDGVPGAVSPVPGQPPGAQAKRGSVPTQGQAKRDHIPLLRSLQLCASQIDNPALVPDLKRNLLHAVYLLIDKTLDETLLIETSLIVKDWLMSPTSSLTVQDRTQFVIRMKRFERVRSVALQNLFMDIVHFVYSEPVPRVDLQTLEGTMVTGMISRDPATRSKFFELFNKKIERDVLKRVEYIMNPATWESMPAALWIGLAVDMVMATIDTEFPLKMSSISAKVPSMNTGNLNLTPEAKELVSKHEEFLNSCRSQKLGVLLEPFRELVHQDNELAMFMWSTLFPLIWDNQLEMADKERMKPTIITLLSKDYHMKQQRNQPNVLQALMRAFLKCKTPRIEIPSELVAFLGKHFCSWHMAIKVLEEKLVKGAVTSIDEQDKCISHLSEIYKTLLEDDLYYGLLYQSATTDISRAGLILQKHNFWQRGQELFYQALLSEQRKETQSVSNWEMNLWEEQWIESAKKLSQWEVLTEYARTNNLGELQVEASWRVQDWSLLKEAFSKFSFNVDAPRIKIIQSFLALYENRIVDVDQLCKNAMRVLVNLWNGLPKTPSLPHVPLLHTFQQIVELYEAAKLLREIRSPNRIQKQQDIKVTLRAWRERLPNEFDDIGLWADLFQWRQQTYTMINAACQADPQAPNLTLIGYHEMAWSIARFARVARRQGLPELCLSLLTKIYSLPNIDVQEAIVKTREQTKCYLNQPELYRSGLDLLNTTNIDWFNPQQKAEFFQLKGMFLARMGFYEESNAAFSTSIALHENLSKGWIAWAKFCDNMLTSHLASGKETDANYNKTKMLWSQYAVNCYLQGIKCNPASPSRKHLARVLWLLDSDEEASKFDTPSDLVIGEIEKKDAEPEEKKTDGADGEKKDPSIKEEPTTEASEKNPRKRELVNPKKPPAKRARTARGAKPIEGEDDEDKDEDKMEVDIVNENSNGAIVPVVPTGAKGVLADSLEKHFNAMPMWLWLPWINQLLTGLERPLESAVMKALLTRLGMFYPQAVFWPLNTYLGERKSSRAKLNPANQQGLKAAEEILTALRAKHGPLLSTLDRITTEISDKLMPLPEEEMTWHLKQILNQCYNLQEDRAAIVGQLEKVHQIFFSATANAQFVQDYKAEFENDLVVDVTKFNSNQMIERLKSWCHKLTLATERRVKQLKHLEKASHFLVSFQNDSHLEIPGAFLGHEKDVTAEPRGVIIDKFLTPMKILKGKTSALRLLSIRSNVGNVHHFLLHHTGHSLDRTPNGPDYDMGAKSEQRFAQLLQQITKVTQRDIGCKHRSVNMNVPKIVELNNNTRLISVSERFFKSLHDLYEDYCNKKGMESDTPFMYIRKRMAANTKLMTPAQLQELKLQAFEEVSKDYIPDTIFSDYIYYKMLESYEMCWEFKRHFSVQWAMSSLMSHLFAVTNRHAQSVIFTPESAQVHLQQFKPNYDGKGLLSNTETVPFRLGLNVQKFFGGMYTVGAFNGAMTACTLAIGKKNRKDNLANVINLMFRDEAYDAANTKGFTELSIHELTRRNTQYVLERLDELMPPVRPEQPVTTTPVNAKITELIESATNKANLANMDISWQPWL